MARPRRIAYPEPEPGTIPYILRDLLQADGRSARGLGISAGLSSDAVRNILRQTVRPRPATLAALASALKVDVSVFGATAAASPPASRGPDAVSANVQVGGDAVRDALKNAVRAAVRAAVSAGCDPRVALKDSVMASLLATVGVGLDDAVAVNVVADIVR